NRPRAISHCSPARLGRPRAGSHSAGCGPLAHACHLRREGNMSPVSYCCEVCAAPKHDTDWFLVTQDPLRDTLRVLKWDSRIADKPGVRHVCSPAHVEDLVSQWVLTGSLDYGCPANLSLQASTAAPRGCTE